MKYALILASLAAFAFVAACGSAYVTPESSSVAQQSLSETSVPTTVDPMATVGSKPPTGEISSEDGLAVSYLEATVEPCSPIAGSDRDPCEAGRFEDREFTWWLNYHHPRGVPGFGVKGSYDIIHPPMTVRQKVEDLLVYNVYDDVVFNPFYAPHIVARGVYLPSTTRCTVHDQTIAHIAGQIGVFQAHEQKKDSILRFTQCFMEFDVREYIVGKGPETLTIVPVSRPTYVAANHELYKEGAYLDGLARHIEDIWSGAESIVWLAPADSDRAHVEVWHVVWPFDVEMLDDGRVVVTDPTYFPTLDRSEDLRPYQHLIKPELDVYRRDIRIAFEELADEHDLTLLDDANLHHMREFRKNLGLHDFDEVEVVPPPPVPLGE